MSDGDELTRLTLGPKGRALRAIMREYAADFIRARDAELSAAMAGSERTAAPDGDDLRRTLDRYRQALVDIAGHENWQEETMGDIAREALGVVYPPELDGDRSDEQDV